MTPFFAAWGKRTVAISLGLGNLPSSRHSRRVAVEGAESGGLDAAIGDALDQGLGLRQRLIGVLGDGPFVADLLREGPEADHGEGDGELSLPRLRCGS